MPVFGIATRHWRWRTFFLPGLMLDKNIVIALQYGTDPRHQARKQATQHVSADAG